MLAVITGGSTGIGFELAKEFARHGYDLVIVAHGPELEESAEELRRLGRDVQALKLDLSVMEDVIRLHEAVDTLDALVLNAGTTVYGDFVRHNSFDDEMKLLGLNVVAPVALAKLLIPKMFASKCPRVLITSSVASRMPGPMYATYAASKSFLLSFGLALRNELSDTNVSVSCLLPAATDTAIFQRTGMARTRVNALPKDSAEKVARVAFAALMKGDEIILPSWVAWIEATGARILPERVLAYMQRQITKAN